MSQSVHAALPVLGAVAEHPGLGLSELARLTEMNKSRTYRMLSALAQDGYVDQGSDGAYHLGIQALVIGRAARTSVDLVRRIEAAVEDQMREIDENIQARKRDGHEVVQIFSRKSRQQL